jgi:hypothetical protein
MIYGNESGVLLMSSWFAPQYFLQQKMRKMRNQPDGIHF